MEDIKKIIANNIQQLRRETGITQLDLAWITGYLLGEISEDDLALAYIVPVEDAE